MHLKKNLLLLSLLLFLTNTATAQDCSPLSLGEPSLDASEADSLILIPPRGGEHQALTLWYYHIKWNASHNTILQEAQDFILTTSVENEQTLSLDQGNFPLLKYTDIKEITFHFSIDGNQVIITPTTKLKNGKEKTYEPKSLKKGKSKTFNIHLFEEEPNIKLFLTIINFKEQPTFTEAEEHAATWEPTLLTNNQQAQISGSRTLIPRGQDATFTVSGGINPRGSFKIYTKDNEIALSSSDTTCAEARCTATLKTKNLFPEDYTLRYLWSVDTQLSTTPGLKLRIGEPSGSVGTLGQNTIRLNITTITEVKIPKTPTIKNHARDIYDAALDGKKLVFIGNSTIKDAIMNLCRGCPDQEAYGSSSYSVIQLSEVLRNPSSTNNLCPLEGAGGSILFLPSTLPKQEEEPQEEISLPENSCTDSDGNNTEIRGTTILKEEDQTKIFTDECLSENQLEEKTCKEKTIQATTIPCTCENGACVPQEGLKKESFLTRVLNFFLALKNKLFSPEAGNSTNTPK